jgi:hypothetical protein
MITLQLSERSLSCVYDTAVCYWVRTAVIWAPKKLKQRETGFRFATRVLQDFLLAQLSTVYTFWVILDFMFAKNNVTVSWKKMMWDENECGEKLR